MSLAVVILAAGKGTRMKSALPKVLHPLAGRPLLRHVVDTARRLDPARIVVVYGHGGEQVRARIRGDDIEWIEQAEQLGTGHAVQQALPALAGIQRTLVLYGDVPLIRETTLRRFLDAAATTSIGLISQILDDASGYGRIVRDASGRVRAIVEHKDATPEQLAIREINTGIMTFDNPRLAEWLGGLRNDNAQGEYYLTDLVAAAVATGEEVATASPDHPAEVAGVNDRAQLAALERVYQGWRAEALMREGVSLADPARIDVRGELKAGQDGFIDINCVFEGRVRLGEGVRIGPNCMLRDAEIGDGAEILANSHIDGARVGPGSRVGPFARLRPGTDLVEAAHIGNFVELKNAHVGTGSKINHLSYVGDAEVGSGVNIGAGVITCNYDGANKHRTRIGDNAFIGSDVQLIAPVEVGAGATIGAGSTLVKDAPDGELTLSRARQVTVEGWKRPVKKTD